MKTRQKFRKGTILVSFFVFPAIFYYLSPVLILQASSQGIINGSFVVFICLFLSALFLGRGYCGWLCPGAGCQEAIFLARDKKVTSGGYIKWLLWLPWIGAIIYLAIRSGGYHTVDFFYMTRFGLSVSNIEGFVAYMLVLLLLIVMPAFVFGKRSFCHHLCWMAPFMILGRKVRIYFHWTSLQLQSNADFCNHCHVCDKHCPMSLPVESMVGRQEMEHGECILCGTCVDICRQGAISFAWGKTSQGTRGEGDKSLADKREETR